MTIELSQQEIEDEIEDLKFEIDALCEKMQPIHIRFCGGVIAGLGPEEAYAKAKGDLGCGSDWEYILKLDDVKKFLRFSKRLMALECRESAYAGRDWKRRTLANLIEYTAKAANIASGDRLKPTDSLPVILKQFDARSAIAAMGELNKMDGEYRQPAKEKESTKNVQGLVDRILSENEKSAG